MKKKSLILLTASILSLGVVGGTFAAWAVTDNADPFEVKVSPGTAQTDTTTNYVTLSWGSSKEVSNVANLKLDTYRKVGKVGLLADTSNSDSFKGKLTITATGDSSLLAALNIKLYEGNLTDTDGVISSATIAAATEIVLTNGAVDITVTDATEKIVTPVVYLSSLTAAQYDALKNAVVTLQFDWGVGTGVDVVTTKTFYTTGFGNGDVYAYAWKGEAQNAAWPGVKMNSAVVAGYKAAEINISAYDYVIFHNNVEGDGAKKSGDIAIATSFTGTNNLFTYDGTTGTAKGTFSHHDDEVEVEYYIVGQDFTIGTTSFDDPAGWAPQAAGKLTLSNGVASIDVTTNGNAQLKIYENTSATWYSNNGGNFILGDAGTYTITFRVNPGNNEQYISAVKK